MSDAQLEAAIEKAWEAREEISAATTGEMRDAVEQALNMLDSGSARVAEKQGGEWIVNQWLKKAVLLSFRLYNMEPIKGGPGDSAWWDKVPSKFDGWGAKEFADAGFPFSGQSLLLPSIQCPFAAKLRGLACASRTYLLSSSMPPCRPRQHQSTLAPSWPSSCPVERNIAPVTCCLHLVRLVESPSS